MGSEQNTTEVSFRCPQISNSVTDNRTLHLLTLSQLCAKLRFLLSAPTMSLSRGLHQILVKLPACKNGLLDGDLFPSHLSDSRSGGMGSL